MTHANLGVVALLGYEPVDGGESRSGNGLVPDRATAVAIEPRQPSYRLH
jgi:hypothetical protein